jgi:type II secretory pathway pseudopilin PulG
MFIISKQKGFTLLETLVYIALIMFVMGAGIAGAYYLIDSSDSDNAEINTLAEAEFLLRKIDWVLTGVNTINVPAPGSDAPKLSVNKTVGPNPIEIETSSEQAQIKRGGGPTEILTGDRVKITGMKFTLIDNLAPKPDAVKAEFYADSKYFELYKYLRK